MKRRLSLTLLAVAAVASFSAGMIALAADAKLPKCSQVKCRQLGCPADVLCATGTTVKSCADICNGH